MGYTPKLQECCHEREHRSWEEREEGGRKGKSGKQRYGSLERLGLVRLHLEEGHTLGMPLTEEGLGIAPD